MNYILAQSCHRSESYADCDRPLRFSFKFSTSQSSSEQSKAYSGAFIPENNQFRGNLVHLLPTWHLSAPAPCLSAPSAQHRPQQDHHHASARFPLSPQPGHGNPRHHGGTPHPPSPRMNSPISPPSPAPGGTQWARRESCTCLTHSDTSLLQPA
jgi:hypothetical protein